MTTLTDSEQRLVERVHETYMQTWVSICIRESLAIALRATGLPISTLAALADGTMVAVPLPVVKHWVGKPSNIVPCDAMGEGAGCSLCQDAFLVSSATESGND